MKPVKNQYYCFDCGRTKMLFETQKKADNFIKFNKDAFEEEGKKVPVRSYYCEACGGWHVTSNPHEEHFRMPLSGHRQLTKLGRMVEVKMQKSQHESFLIRKSNLISEAKDLYQAQDFLGSLKKCREALQLLKDNGKDWWNDNWYVKRLMYDNVCREASNIDNCFKNNDYRKAENIISHCGCVMKELEDTEGFDEYRSVLNQYLDLSIDKLKKNRQAEGAKARLKSITRKINEAWVYLSQKKFSKVKTEIDKYTTELVSMSKNNGKEELLPVVNKLYNLREAYISQIGIAA